MQIIRGKTALVTGAGSGIGRSIALALAKAGAHVVVADLRSHTASEVCAEIQKLGGAANAEQVDVSDHDSVEHLAMRVYERHGALDILCNNAGVSWRPLRTILETKLSDWQFMLGVNLWGVVNCLDVFVPKMVKQTGEKHIVTTSSFAAVWPLEGTAPYSATKAAVTALSEAISIELAPHGFGVTILHPAMVKTNIAANSDELRRPGDKTADRAFTPIDSARIARMQAEMIEPDAVGEMVRDAIERNQLYLYTHAISADELAGRFDTVFGTHTCGRRT